VKNDVAMGHPGAHRFQMPNFSVFISIQRKYLLTILADAL